MQGDAVLVEVTNVARDAAIEEVGGFVVGPQVHVPVAAEMELQPLVEVGHLLEPQGQHIKVVLNRRKDLRVGHEGDDGAGLPIQRWVEWRRSEVGRALPTRELLREDLVVAVDLDSELQGEGVDRRNPHAVKSAGDRVGLSAELAPCVEGSHHCLYSGDAGRFVGVRRNSTAVVLYPHRAVLLNVDAHPGTPARHELVHAVVHDLEYQLVEAPLVRAADVHAGPAPHRLHPLQHLDVAGCVGLCLVTQFFCGH